MGNLHLKEFLVKPAQFLKTAFGKTAQFLKTAFRENIFGKKIKMLRNKEKK